MSFTIGAIALAVAAAFGGMAGYKATSAHYEHVIAVEADKARQAVETANQQAQDAAGKYEAWKAAQRPKTITITREVARAVQADTDCSAKPLPDGLRAALAQAAADSNQPVAADPVSAASSATPFDLGANGAGLFGRARGVGRLSSPTQSTQ